MVLQCILIISRNAVGLNGTIVKYTFRFCWVCFRTQHKPSSVFFCLKTISFVLSFAKKPLQNLQCNLHILKDFFSHAKMFFFVSFRNDIYMLFCYSFRFSWPLASTQFGRGALQVRDHEKWTTDTFNYQTRLDWITHASLLPLHFNFQQKDYKNQSTEKTIILN